MNLHQEMGRDQWIGEEMTIDAKGRQEMLGDIKERGRG
jgi:hypothetical protein